MAKGRRFVPSREKDGIWFQTRGWPKTFDSSKPRVTTVPSPPKVFKQKEESPYKSFLFSKHDNRHDLQNHGVYFGNGLGKRNLPYRSQHYSSNMITWGMNNDHASQYTTSYRGTTADPASLRRYPRTHPEAKPGTAPLTTTSAQWFNPSVHGQYRTPLHVLAQTQEPLLPPNRWVYSYRPKGQKHLRRYITLGVPETKNLFLRGDMWSEMGKHYAKAKEIDFTPNHKLF